MSYDPSPDWRDRLLAETPAARVHRPALDAATVPGLTILGHPDPTWVGARAVLRELGAGREAALSRLEPRFVLGGGEARPLADPFVSRQPWKVLAEGEGGVRLVRGASGSDLEADGEAIAEEGVFERSRLERGVVLLLADRVALLLHTLPASPLPKAPSWGLVGESPVMVRVYQEIHQVAGFEIPILLRGETGTGKELVARAIHDAGSRRGPYLAINMVAVPPSLATAELFGAAKGAYTGADRRQQGYFQRADGGTLFLDEVGEMIPEVQALLLRTLESGEIQPVGGGEPRKVDVRVVAATDSDLETQIAAGKFRAPLLHRLTGYEIFLPPLRGRRDDIGRLLFHFLRQELDNLGEGGRLVPAPGREPWMPAALVARLALYDWPGNVRQVRNVVRQLVISNRDAAQVKAGPRIERLLRMAGAASDPQVSDPETTADFQATELPTSRRKPSRVGEDEMLAALRAHRYEVKSAARGLGISRASLYLMMRRSSRVRKAADLGRDEIVDCRDRQGGDVAGMAAELEVSEEGLRQRMRVLGLREFR